jgi:dihydrofolate reductase
MAAPGEDDGSWLRIDAPLHRAFNELAAAATCFVYGRKVFEYMVPYWPDAVGDATKPDYEREYGRIWVDKPKLVASRTMQQAGWGTRVVAEDAVDEVARLRARTDGYVLCYGGAEFVAALQRAGLVDEYMLFMHPTVLGEGVPFFRNRIALALKEIRTFPEGSLQMRLGVVR